MTQPLPRLKDFNALARLGLTAIVLTVVVGYGFSGMHLKAHHEMRDDRPGLTMTDFQGAYHGVVAPSPLIDALESGHPDTLADADRQGLLGWLRGDRVREDYDNFDLEVMPEDVIAASCVECHSRSVSGEGAYPALPLDYPDDVFGIAFSREIQPTNDRIRVMSIHAHAPTMAIVLLAVAGPAVMTRWCQLVMGGLIAAGGLGLMADIAGQWFSRGSPEAVYAVVAGGFVYVACVCLLAAAVLVDCWLPGGASTPCCGDSTGPPAG